MLIEAMRGGAVEDLCFNGLDLSALGAEAFLVVVGCRGLKSLVLHRSVFPSGFVADDLMRASAAKGLLRLGFFKNKCATLPRVSEDAILDFFFPANAAPKRDSVSLELDGSAVTEIFLTKFFEVSILILRVFSDIGALLS